MNELLGERIAHCLSVDGMQAAKRHIELLDEGWSPRSQFYLFRVNQRSVERLEAEITGQMSCRGLDLGHIAIDSCVIGHEQLLQTQHEEVVYEFTPGIGLWYPAEANDAS